MIEVTIFDKWLESLFFVIVQYPAKEYLEDSRNPNTGVSLDLKGLNRNCYPTKELSDFLIFVVQFGQNKTSINPFPCLVNQF